MRTQMQPAQCDTNCEQDEDEDEEVEDWQQQLSDGESVRFELESLSQPSSLKQLMRMTRFFLVS